MYSLESRDKYHDVVAALQAEFADEIACGGARSVANHLVADVELAENTPTILDAVEYEGASVESLDRCLCPMDVLQYSTATVDPERQSTKWVDVPALAAIALAKDLNSPQRQSTTSGHSDPTAESGELKAPDREETTQ